jgi:hypothetical protein
MRGRRRVDLFKSRPVAKVQEEEGKREGEEEEQEEEEEEEHCDDGKGGGGRAVVRLPRGPLPPRKQQVLAMLHHLRTAA